MPSLPLPPFFFFSTSLKIEIIPRKVHFAFHPIQSLACSLISRSLSQQVENVVFRPNAFSPSSLQMFTVIYLGLTFIWLKLMIPWRFFRLWAMADGVLVHENMKRCMSMNYSLTGFWRNWHCSFNRWLVRYVYVPLGGSHGTGVLRRSFNTFLTFAFVGFWHELNTKLFLWAVLISVFFCVELAVMAQCRRPAMQRFACEWPRLSIHVAAFLKTAIVYCMMVGNVVGYADVIGRISFEGETSWKDLFRQVSLLWANMFDSLPMWDFVRVYPFMLLGECWDYDDECAPKPTAGAASAGGNTRKDK
jgi:D-alanyl-lipoteichoic acid acyltransferase DltB (MBOAT superfamily)